MNNRSEANGPETLGLAIEGLSLPAQLMLPAEPRGIVLYAIANGCVRESARALLIARRLEREGFGTIVFSLLTEIEAEQDRHSGDWSFDVPALTLRMLRATHWVMREARCRGLGIGYLATSTGAAAAFAAAAQLGDVVRAVVSRGGRPDFAGDALGLVTAAALLIVGEKDEGVLRLNRQAYDLLRGRKQLVVIPGASHLFDEPGALEQVATISAAWFHKFLEPAHAAAPLASQSH